MKRTTRPHSYRNTDSYAVHKLTHDAHALEQGPVLAVRPTQDEAEAFALEQRNRRQWPEGVGFVVVARYHDSKGKITDREDVNIL